MPVMVKSLKIVWSFLSTAFSGFGNIICERIFKNKKSKKRNQKSKSFYNDKEIILHSIECHTYDNQRAIFMRYFYKYKKHFDADDVEKLTQKLEENHPNYDVLLNILLGLIESVNQF